MGNLYINLKDIRTSSLAYNKSSVRTLKKGAVVKLMSNIQEFGLVKLVDQHSDIEFYVHKDKLKSNFKLLPAEHLGYYLF